MSLFYLYPDGVDFNDSHTAVGAATLNECVDDGVAAPDDDATYAQVNTSASARKVRFTLTTMPDVASISRITVFIRGSNGSTSSITHTPYLYISATEYAGAAHPANGPYVLFADTWTTNPNTGVAWTKANLDALVVGVTTSIDALNVPRLTQVYVEVEAIALPARLGAARHRGSAEIHLRRAALPTMMARLGGGMAILALDRELLADHAAWQHFAGPTVKDEGWGLKPWQRRYGTLISRDFDLDAMEVTVTDLDLRRYLVHFRDSMCSEEVPSPQDQGVLRLDPGAGRVYARTTAAWIQNPAAAAQGIMQIVRVAADDERLSILGNVSGSGGGTGLEAELIEPQRTNSALRSSYVNGLTGITTGGASTISADTTAEHLLFESAESPNSLKFVAGNPHSSDGTAAHPATAAFAASDRIVVSYYHKDDGGEALGIKIQRSSDSWYWDDAPSVKAWVAGSTVNLMPISQPRYSRWVSNVIDVGAGTPTITATIVQPSGGTVSRVNRGGHLQIELGRSATSPIVTTTAAVTRNADSLKIENFTGKVVYDPARMTGYIEGVPNFNSADLASGSVRTLLRAYKDANNFDTLRYNQTTGAFEFSRVVGGVTYTASKTQALTRNTRYKIGFRATGTDAEEDLAAYTLSVFIDGVKGTDATAGSTWTPAAAEYLYAGQDQGGSDVWDGGLRQIVIRPYVLADDEFLDQP